MLEREVPTPTDDHKDLTLNTDVNPNADDHLNPTVNSSAFTEVWHSISEIFQDFLKVCHEGIKAIGACLSALTRFGGHSLAFIWNRLFKPLILTFINIGAYFLDKILYGSPGLRQYLHDGVMSSEPPSAWREFVRENSGWDIYSNTHPVLDNVFGALGAGIGILNMFNHLLTSYGYHVYNYSHVLSTYGVFGKRLTKTDKCNLPLQLTFGLLSMPLVIPSILLTNAVDALATFLSHFYQSWIHNTSPILNLLGTNGVMGKRRAYKDDRGWPAIIVYGVFSAPLVAGSALITNVIDGVLTFFKNFFLSLGRNLRSTFNLLLGKHGIMGERVKYSDDRHLITRMVYGALSSPLVLLCAAITNLIDLSVTFVKKIGFVLDHYLRPFAADFGVNLGQSFIRNISSIFNLLGKNGVMGERKAYDDDRPLSARIFYGALTAPVVGLAALFTNLVDIFCAGVKHTFISWWRNQRAVFNLLGEYGVMGKHRQWKDERGWPAIIGFGVLSAPLVLATALVTNVIDGVVRFFGEFFISWYQNQRPIFNLLGKHGVMGERRTWEDSNRGWPEIIVFGVVSSPLVLLTAAVTNIVDGVCTFFLNLGLSFLRNLTPIYHGLGKYGMMGERDKYVDERGIITKLFYGLVSAPFVLIAAALTNLIDVIGSYFKNYKNTIFKPALLCTGVVTGVLTAPVAFVLRKMLKGLYHFTAKPIMDCANDEPFNGTRMLKGVANFFTLGLFSAVKKVFKACTGYTDRFGFPNHQNHLSGGDYFQETENTFRDAINLAAHGKFPNVHDGKHHFRMIMRIFYGFHHKVEDVVKAFHDAYLRYAKVLENTHTPKSDAHYNMHYFFQSSDFKQVESSIQADLKAEEEKILNNVEAYLMPAPQ